MAPSHLDNVSASAAKLFPGSPSTVMVIRDITPNLTTLSVPFARFGRIHLGGRGTIVRLQSGGLAVFSPVALTTEVESKLSAHGNKVQYLIAPDFEHHIFLGPWAKAYPSAEVIAVGGLPEKRDKDPKIAGLKFHHIFTKENKLDYKIGGDFDREFDYEYVDVHVNKELVFYHRPTKTVIEADILFNLPPTEQYSHATPDQVSQLNKGILQKIFNTMMSAQGTAIWQKRFLWYMAGAKDRKGFGESVRKMDKWDIERIIPCHGDVIEGPDAKATWDKVFEWFREGKKSK